MPIFHDLHDSPTRAPSPPETPCTGSLDTVTSDAILRERRARIRRTKPAQRATTPLDMAPVAPSELGKPSVSDRTEIMERLKKGTSPVWLQRQEEPISYVQTPEPPVTYLSNPRSRPRTPVHDENDSRLHHALTPEQRDNTAIGLAIERPRSALHSGDFRRSDAANGSADGASSSGFIATSPVVPWHRSFPDGAYSAGQRPTQSALQKAFSNESHAVSRARAISQSSPKSFAFLPPTSPLVYQASSLDLDQSRPGSRQGSRSPERNNRRHTFSPASFHGYQSKEVARSATGTPAARHLRYSGAIPYQAHQPRRSSTFNQIQPQSNPQTPCLHSRGPSFSFDASPLHHAPMVGSYEESILRGRMSTTPSRPLDFVAKIGVLGKGKCKSSLKCPPHVTVPFPAVFYSYNTGNGRISEDEPSPYVGLIDLEHSLTAPEENTELNKRKRRHVFQDADHDELDFRLQFGEEPCETNLKDGLRRKEKRKRRSTSPRAPPGGCYRIPPQGQLQIVLKNPNKTAVKLFLVPYDLSDMEPGQKTFIRQRSYSAGPIIDMPSALRKNLGTDRPEAALSNSDDPNDRPILRYLIHLHICCPSKGRYYLYKSIRVVFANRVPDGKEKLRNEIQLPEPKYSAYRPTRESMTAHPLSSTTSQPISEKVVRRRSAGWPLSRSQQAYDQIDGLPRSEKLPPPAIQFTGGPLSTSTSSGFNTPIQPIPFNFTRLTAIESRPVSRDAMDVDSKDPFRTPVASPKSGLASPLSDRAQAFGKLNKGDVGYGGNAFSPVSSPSTPLSAGLLSQRLRGLDVHPDTSEQS